MSRESFCSEKKNSRNKMTFWPFSDIQLKIFGSLQTYFDGIVKTAFYLSRGTFWWYEKCPEKVWKKYSLPLFWDIERNFSGFLTKLFWQGSRNCIFCVHRIILMRLIIFTKNSIFLGKLSKNISAFCPKVLEAFVRIAFSASRRTLWGKIYFVFCRNWARSYQLPSKN